MTRRRCLVAGAALIFVSGCLGDDGDADDSPEDDETIQADDDNAGTADTDDTTDDASDDSIVEPDIRADFDSYILEMDISHEGPDGEWTQRLYREADIANDTMYHRFEMDGDTDEPAAFDHYIIDGQAYQIGPDGTCIPSGEETVLVYERNPGGFQRAHPDEVDTDADHITYQDTGSIDWVDELVHVWEIDLEPTDDAIDGVLHMYVGVESEYFVGYEGWLTTGAHDDPAEITIEYRRHSFNTDIEIELPDECRDE